VKLSRPFAQLRPHWPLLIVGAVGAALLFTNLGSGYLWADEGDTAVLARNVVKFGFPRAWDGTTFMDSDFGARENSDLVMVSSPWLQYYVTAISFVLFGQNTFAARFPFALVGLLTIAFAYRLVFRATGDRRAALCATILMIGSVQFLLFCRQSRYYAVEMLLTCLLTDAFLQLRSAGRAVIFTVVAVLLFHAHPIGIVPVIALGLLTLLARNFSAQRRWYWLSVPVILALTTPWFLLARGGYTENASLVSSARDFVLRFIQYLVESASVTPLIGVVVLFLLMSSLQRRAHLFQERDRQLLVTIATIIASLAGAMAVTQRSAALWVTGVRYTSAIIPLVALLGGVLISRISRGRLSILLPLIGVFALTKSAQLTAWSFWGDKSPDPEKKLVALHVPINTIDAFLPREDLLFVRGLFEKNIGTLGQSVEFLRQHAAPDDLVITNYESEPLYFHTNLLQGMKIMRQDPIFDAARRYGLPEYIFGVDHARWVVWRFNWDDYLGIRWPEVADHLLAEGGHITNAAELKETGWENRENIHFHRFSNDVYLFPQDTNLSPAIIFRVDWASR
jgi:Dolichyl-phosphate-mannose-protein mannosyltransferase